MVCIWFFLKLTASAFPLRRLLPGELLSQVPWRLLCRWLRHSLQAAKSKIKALTDPRLLCPPQGHQTHEYLLCGQNGSEVMGSQ